MTTGASNDIERATDIARKMVTQWGMSEEMGPMLYAEEDGEVFLGRSMAKAKHMSDDTARAIDAEIKHVINRNYDRAKHILMDNLDILHAMKDALMKYETIDAKQIDDLMMRREVRLPADYDKDQKPAVDDGVTPEPAVADEVVAAEPALSDEAKKDEHPQS